MTFDIEVPVYMVVRVAADSAGSAVLAAETLASDFAHSPAFSRPTVSRPIEGANIETISFALLSEDEDRTPDVYPI